MKKIEVYNVVAELYIGKRGVYMLTKAYNRSIGLVKSIWYTTNDVLEYNKARELVIKRVTKKYDQMNKKYMSRKRNPAKVQLKKIILHKRLSKKFLLNFENDNEEVLDII